MSKTQSGDSGAAWWRERQSEDVPMRGHYRAHSAQLSYVSKA